MDFPVWHFTGIGSGLIMGVVSVLHVFIAQFAVGGGIYLVWMERKAHRENSLQLLEWLEHHTRFFLLVTMVFGGISGVGIWFTMCVISPGGTSMLIHNFVFFWATEWGFFLIEVVSLLAYYYTYSWCRKGLITAKTHMQIGLVYAVAGYMSLVLINGIITFMLTPGEGLETGNVWRGFFNPTYLPSLVFRTGVCLVLAGMFALFTAPRIANDNTRRSTVRTSSLWIAIPFILLLAGSAWYFAALPPSRFHAILRRTDDIRPFLMAYGWILPLVFLGGILAFVRAERLRKPLTVLILCSGLALVCSFEFIRETGRRPWIAEDYMYSNGISVTQAKQAEKHGVASISGWIQTIEAYTDGSMEPKAPLAVGLDKGAIIFAQQCGTCHGIGGPRIDIIPRVNRLHPAGLEAQLRGEGKRLDYMPPFFGSTADRKALMAYLYSIRSPRQTIPSPEVP